VCLDKAPELQYHESMKAYLIWNPAAGQRDVRHGLEEACKTLEAADWTVRLRETVCPGDGTDLAREAVANGADVAIAAGGDGTVSEVVNGLVGSQVALGVLPVGTGNVWAKEMGYPIWVPPNRHPLRMAAQALLDASVHRVDVGCANGRHFLLWAGAGFDALVAHEVETSMIEMRRRVGNVTYALTALNLAMSFVGNRCTVVVDGKVRRQRVVQMIISNAHLYGGGLVRLAPTACLDDGYLNVLLFRGQGTAATLHHVFSLLAQSHLRDPRVDYYRAQQVEIYSEKPMPVQLDGDAYGQTPLRVHVVPQALNVLVPPTASNTLFARPAMEYVQ